MLRMAIASFRSHDIIEIHLAFNITMAETHARAERSGRNLHDLAEGKLPITASAPLPPSNA